MKTKRFEPKFSSFVLFGFILALAGMMFGIFGLSKLTTIPAAKVAENSINIVFAFIIGIFMIIFATDMLFRHKVSHIACTFIGQLLLIVYTLLRMISSFQANEFKATTGAIFYAITLVAELVLAYSIVEKALDGDASIVFVISFVVEILFIVFASFQVYSLFDVWGEKDNNVYWMGVFDSLIIMGFSCYVYFVALKSDYEPHPIKLDQFGNPVDEKK